MAISNADEKDLCFIFTMHGYTIKPPLQTEI